MFTHLGIGIPIPQIFGLKNSYVSYVSRGMINTHEIQKTL